MMDNKELQLGDIRALWPQIRPGIEEIQQSQGADWIPEDIYHWVQSDKATLYVTDDGFTIVQRGQNEITKEIYLYILISYSWSQEKNIVAYLPAFEALARNIGAAYIETRTTRRGLEKLGFELDQVTYRRRV